MHAKFQLTRLCRSCIFEKVPLSLSDTLQKSKCSSSLGLSWESNEARLGWQVGARARLTEKYNFSPYPKVSVSVSKFETKLVSVSVSNLETKITKSQSQSQNLRLKSKVSVSVSKIDTSIKSLSLNF